MLTDNQIDAMTLTDLVRACTKLGFTVSVGLDKPKRESVGPSESLGAKDALRGERLTKLTDVSIEADVAWMEYSEQVQNELGLARPDDELSYPAFCYGYKAKMLASKEADQYDRICHLEATIRWAIHRFSEISSGDGSGHKDLAAALSRMTGIEVEE